MNYAQAELRYLIQNLLSDSRWKYSSAIYGRFRGAGQLSFRPIKHVRVSPYRSTLLCPGCRRQSDKLESFLFISLPIPLKATGTSPSGRRTKTQRRPSVGIYVVVVRATSLQQQQQQPAIRHGFQLPASKRSTVAKFKRLISEATDIPRRQVCNVVVTMPCRA